MNYNEIKEKILSLYPTTCPACGKPIELSKNMMHLYCTNPSCSGKLYRRIEIMAKAFEIDFIGVKVAEELVEHCNIQSLGDFMRLTKEVIAQVPRYKDGMVTRIYDSINAHRKVEWVKFIRGIQLLRVGDGTAAELAEGYDSLEALLNTNVDEMFRKLKTGGEATASIIVNSIRQQAAEIRDLATEVEIVYETVKEDTTAPTGIKELMAVVTGSLVSGSRPDFQAQWGAKYGIRWVGAVSTNTDILVTNESSSSKKYKTAKAIQDKGGKIQIMTEHEFIAFCRERVPTTPEVLETTNEKPVFTTVTI